MCCVTLNKIILLYIRIGILEEIYIFEDDILDSKTLRSGLLVI
jgi:hypothetical protein